MRVLPTDYIVTKKDGTPVDSSASYLVLRLDSNEAARQAASTYIDYAKSPYGKIVSDWLDEFLETDGEGYPL